MIDRRILGMESGEVDAYAHIPWLRTASKRARYLVGVSGGADSVALLHLLVEAGFSNLIVCHMDHRLRGRASTGDARFVERLAQSLGLACEVGREDVKARMKQTGESMETAARHARHGFFAACASKHRCATVLLAHHAEDQGETVLWNLLRGSRGLKGMKAEQSLRVGKKSLNLIRPLLGVRKCDLLGWLEQRALPWREDASNAEPVAVRNRLRHEVLPLLGEISGRDAVAALLRAANDFEAMADAENELLAAAQLLDPQGRLHLPSVRKLPATLQRSAIRNYLSEHSVQDIDRSLLERAQAMLEVSQPAVINLPGGKHLRRRAGRLWVET